MATVPLSIAHNIFFGIWVSQWLSTLSKSFGSFRIASTAYQIIAHIVNTSSIICGNVKAHTTRPLLTGLLN